MEIVQQLSITELLLVLFAAFIIGLAKAGLKGIDMLNVTIMALVFGGKSSTGIVLPLLCLADVAAVLYYHRHAQWNHFKKLVPWMLVGILVAVLAGKNMNEILFRRIMAVIILLSVIIILYMEARKSATVPTNPLFVSGTGMAAGFTTMMGNLAGAFANLYFLAMRLPKNDFIGTAAWVFLVINFFKLPFQVFYWHNISTATLQADALLAPALGAGFWAGIKIVQRLKDDRYRKLVILLTLAGALLIFVKR